MGPNKAPGLFSGTVSTQGMEGRLVDELDRRVVLSGTLGDLSQAFADGPDTAHCVTEATLPFKLFALAAVQHTAMGVAGANPANAVRYESSVPSVSAKVAPPHDSFDSAVAQAAVQTRAIMFTLEHDRYGRSDEEEDPIEFFGLNMFIGEVAPDPGVFTGTQPDTTPKLLIAGVGGKIGTSDAFKAESREPYVAGETAVLAVRNTKTRDAKVYTVTELSPDKIDPVAMHDYRVGSPKFIQTEGGDQAAHVMMPTGQILVVTALKGELRKQTADEFAAAVEAMKGGAKEKLAGAELAAAIDPLSAP